MEKIEVPAEQLETLLQQNKELKEALSGAVKIISLLKEKLLDGQEMPDFKKMSFMKKTQFGISLIGRITSLNEDADGNFLEQLGKNFEALSHLKKYLSETEIKTIE